MRFKQPVHQCLSTIETSVKALEYFLRTRPTSETEQKDIESKLYQIQKALEQSRTYLSNESDDFK